jgi:ABC-type Fe3+-hydroxamate transport system substrate-binding protein
MALRSGTIIDGYRIDRVLGVGGMGTVYLADNPVLPRQDALKILSAELSASPDFRARFTREADLASTLDHPHIVTVYSRGETDAGQLWIAMQYVPGSDAEKEIVARRMTPTRAVRILTQVAQALDYAHRRGLVHRDVKPANFLLTDDDERILLADFGIARALDNSAELTGTGTLIATVAYAAPEVLTGSTQIDGRADIYALGCSLFRMLTGQTPFARAGSIPATMAAHLHTPPPTVTALRPELPAALDAVIATAMAKDPAHRYRTARELAAAATAALDAAGGGTAEWVTPSPDALAAAAAAITYPSGAFSGPTTALPPSAPPAALPPPVDPAAGIAVAHPPPVPPRRPVGRRPAVIAAVIALLAAVTGGAWWMTAARSESYPERTVGHSLGGTRITDRPTAVAALGPGDADAVLSLGVQPVAVRTAGGSLPGYLQRLVTGNVKTLPALDPTAIAITRPDLLIDTGMVDQAQYVALSAIAATVTRPEGTSWTWQDQLSWIGDLLGRGEAAQGVLSAAETRRAQIQDAHPAFDAKSVVAVTVADSGVTAAPAGSRAADYLESLGMRYSQQLPAAGPDAIPVDPAALNDTPTDVRIVLRTDRGAGGGNYNGLPKPFTAYRGATVIVDDPEVITALNTGGAAATEFLNTTLVNAITEMVH